MLNKHPFLANLLIVLSIYILYIYIYIYGCFQNRGTPKWMVKIGEHPIFLMDDLVGFPIVFGSTPI